MKKLWDWFIWLSGVVHERVKQECPGIGITGAVLISIGISLAISAIAYGLQTLLAPHPPKATGPQKDDLAAPISKPGQPIPFAVGHNFAGGQNIWSSGLVETKHVDKVKGGKGGGKSQKVESFTYSVSQAVAFNDGEIGCLLRVLGNGSKLIYSARLSDTLTSAQIDAQVSDKYDEVFAEDLAFWQSVLDSEGNRVYSDQQASQTADANATSESEELEQELESAQNDSKTRYGEMEIHLGTEDQQPSAIIESFEGVGNVPAFRGTAYVVFRDLQLADFGNAVPILEFDYGTNGVINGVEGRTVTTGDVDTYVDDPTEHLYFIDYTRGKLFSPLGPGGFYGIETVLYEYDLATLDYVDTHDISIGAAGAMDLRGFDEVTGYLFGWHSTNPPGPDSFASRNYVYDPATKAMIAETTTSEANFLLSPSDFDIQHYVAIWSESGSFAAVLSTDFDSESSSRKTALNFPALTFNSRLASPEEDVEEGTPLRPKYMTGAINGVRGGDTAWAAWVSFDNMIFYSYTIDNSGVITPTAYAAIPSTAFHATKAYVKLGLEWTPYVDESDGTIVMWIHMGDVESTWDTTYVFKWDPAAEEVLWVTEYPEFYVAQYPRMNVRFNGGIARQFTNWTVPYALNLETGAVTDDSGSFEAGEVAAFQNYSPCWDSFTGCFYTVKSGGFFNVFRKFCFPVDECGVDPVDLKTVIETYLQKAGYSSNEYEVATELSTEVIHGFNNNKGRTVREVLEDLAKIRPVSALESERKLKFKLQDSTSRVTIPISDVRAYEGSSTPPDWINEVSTQEDLALPQSLQINYQDQNRLLNTVPVYFKREVTQSQTASQFSTEAVDTADNMRRSIFNAMSQLMVTKRTFKLSLPSKYIGLEPGDRITVPVSDTATADVRITRTDRGANGVIELTCVRFVDFDFEVEVPLDFAFISPDTADVLLASRLHFIDSPYLTNLPELDSADDEDRGVYVAVSNNGSPPGANLFVDNNDIQLVSDGGSPPTFAQLTGDPEWLLVSTFSSFADDGSYVRGLDANAVPYVVDTASEFVVAFRNGAASFISISDNAILTSQDNVFKIGNEILQAQTATLIGTSPGGLPTYQFTDLYRGIQGTEWAISESGGPGAGVDVLHLNPNSIQRVDPGNADLVGKTITFRAVTVGQEIADVADTDGVYAGRSRLPYAPGISDAVRDGSDNLTFTLIQRVRYGRDWDDGGSPAFQTDPDTFEVDVIDNTGSPGTVVRTIVSSGDPIPSVSYTAAEQTTDFGSAQPAIAMRPYQLNADGTRGFTNEETI